MNDFDLDIGTKVWPNDVPVKVSIVVATFNHESFIRQAIKSLLVQVTNFRVEILVNDDASQDKTASILKEYEYGYRHLFRNFYQTKNQYSQGKKPWLNVLFPAARGEYIALCEGDDYWTDKLKLQKQVDFLEANKKCFLMSHVLPSAKAGSISGWYDMKKLFMEIYIPHTSNFMFRNFNTERYKEELTRMPGAETCLLYIAATEGEIYHADYQVSEYRIHSNGIHNSDSELQKLESLKSQIRLIRKYFDIELLEYLKKQFLIKKELNKINGKYRLDIFLFKLFFIVIKMLSSFKRKMIRVLVLC